MAKNDTILLDGIIDDRLEQSLPSGRRDEVFEYLSFEQVLKDYDLSFDDIRSGSIDGRDDGGIDGFFIFVNGHLLLDSDAFGWPRAGAELEVWVITCKHHNTFQQAPLDKLNASFQEILDFSLGNSDLKGDYSAEVLAKRNDLVAAYRKLSPRLNRFLLNFAYASRGDTKIVGAAISARAAQLENLARTNFSDCEAKFHFFGGSELVALHRQKPNFSLELPFVELFSRGENYILISKLDDYFAFISDNGRLRRYLFDSNVRDFMGLNRVNEDIRATLDDIKSPDFWWLNNGITLLASAASVIGKSIKISDIQIVNGLQTTESIYRYFKENRPTSDGRAVLVKIIVSNDESDRDAIIRSTNNQTLVELASLHATDKIQRDIEDIFARSGLYYERRKNYYVNLGHSPKEIVTPSYVAGGVVALVLRNPQRAITLKPRFMRKDEAYNKVFSQKIPIQFWPEIGQLLKKIDAVLESKRPKRDSGEKFLKKWRYVSAFFVVAKRLGSFNYSMSELYTIEARNIPTGEISGVVDLLEPFTGKAGSGRQVAKMLDRMRSAAGELNKKFGTADFDLWLREGRLELIEPIKKGSRRSKDVQVSDEFVNRVDNLLPDQPWKPGIEKAVISSLGCTRGEYFAATARLIELGKRHKQKDGVLYDNDDNVIDFDPERVDAQTLTLVRRSS